MTLARLNAKQGHGFAAEMENNLIDRLMLRDAKIIVRVLPVLTIVLKGEKFRYPGQVIEVPLDKYDEAVDAMRKRIEQGKIEGVTDPSEAEKLVRKGWLTYNQAMNLAKPRDCKEDSV